MTTPDPEKITKVQLKTQTNIPSTRGAALRNDLKKLEKEIAKLPGSTSENALAILPLWDQIDRKLKELEFLGMELASEKGQLDTFAAQFQKKRALFIQKIGGSQALVEAREIRQPSTDQWWWYLDESLAADRKRNSIRLARNLGVLVVIIILGALVYQRYLAPDPAIQASYSFQRNAEDALVQGDYEAALQNIQNAILNTPDNPELYVLQEVILEALGQHQEAQTSQEIALQKFESDDLYYASLASVYLTIGDFENALADAQTAFKINPDSAIGYLYKAQVYEFQGDIPMAIENYIKADEIAQRLGNVQLQAIIRVSLSNAYQKIPNPSQE